MEKLVVKDFLNAYFELFWNISSSKDMIAIVIKVED